MRIYAGGGIVFVFCLLLSLWWGSWPWRALRAVGLVELYSGITFDPIGMALGIGAILLGLLQSAIAWRNRFKSWVAVIYLLGMVLFWAGLRLQAAESTFGPVEFNAAITVGGAFLLLALFINLVGILKTSAKKEI